MVALKVLSFLNPHFLPQKIKVGSWKPTAVVAEEASEELVAADKATIGA
jgi:hypothetical protein